MANPLQQMVMQPSPLGELFVSMADINGPASYTNGTGNPVSAHAFALQTFKYAFGGISTDGTTNVEFVSPKGPGATTLIARYQVVSTGAEVVNATNLSTKTFRVMALGN